MSNICDIHHVSLIIENVQRSVDFYQGLLGLERAERPDLGFPGVWFKIGERQLHLLQLPDLDTDSVRPEHGGRDHHLAVLVRDLDSLCISLKAKGIAYTRSQSGRVAMFCRDPDGNALEFIQRDEPGEL
jgi:glyoxylase I family protein